MIEVRRRLAENPWAQIGADAIAWELRKLGVKPPPIRTIERILNRAGLVNAGRSRGRPKLRRLPYPTPVVERVSDLHQADLVGPRHLDGGLPFVAFNCVDVAPHAVAIEIAPDQRESSITASTGRLAATGGTQTAAAG